MIHFYQDLDSSVLWIDLSYIVHEVKHDILNLGSVSGDYKIAGIISIASSRF